MSGCKDCGAALAPRNKSGFCKKHAFRAAQQNPAFRANHLAGIKRKIALDPEYKDRLRAQCKAMSADTSIAHKRSRKFVENRTWEKGFVASQTPEARAKAGRTLSERRLAWCPPELRAEYLELLYKHHYKAAEARAMIEAQHEMQLARWRRSVGIVVPPAPDLTPTPEPETVPEVDPIGQALALAAKRFKTTVADITSRSRYREHVVPRYALAVAMRRADMSFPKIAQAVGSVDHSSSIHWRRCGLKLAASDSSFARIVDELTACWPVMERAA